MIFQKPIHLSLRVFEEGKEEEETSHLTSGLCVLTTIGAVSQAVHISVWTYIRDTGLCQLHRNDPWLL